VSVVTLPFVVAVAIDQSRRPALAGTIGAWRLRRAHEHPGPGGGAPAGEGRGAAAELDDGLYKTADRPMPPLAVSTMVWVLILLPLVVIW
jgi:hypothetical protein